MKQAVPFDIQDVIDKQPFGRYQLGIAVLCSALVFADGFDAQAMGFVAPSLIPQLQISRAALGQVISTGLFGMMIGALFSGPLADRFGRRPLLISGALMFALGSLLTATSTSLQSLFLFRFFTGLGMGGVMPNAIALTAEYSPKRIRSTTVMSMFTGFSLGAATSGFVAAGLVPRLGWQSVFIVGGVLPLIIAMLCIAWLPESMRFLASKGSRAETISSTVTTSRRRDASFASTDSGAPSAFHIRKLFSDGRARVTSMLWIVFFMNLLVLYFLNSWLPTAMHDFGIKLEVAIVITALFQIGGSIGAILLGRWFDRGSSYGLLAAIFLLATFAIALISEVANSTGLLAGVVFVAGVCIIGGQTSSNALAAEFYPTEIRSTGLGWALGIGRIGSIIGPSLGGMLLSGRGEIRHIFWAAATATLLAAIAAVAIASDRNQKGQIHA